MDGQKFDKISRAIATSTTRRQAIRGAGTGGILVAVAGVFGVGRLKAAAQDDATPSSDICTLLFHAETVVGPDKPDIYDGEINLEIGADGAIDSGTFRDEDGNEFDLVGQATGRALNLRIKLDDGFLSLTGTGQRDIELCRGDIEGTFGGPRQRDLGTWSLSRKPRAINSGTPSATSTSGSGDNGGNAGAPTVTPTPCPAIDCGSTFVLDPNTCECGCPPPYDRCGDSTCCFGGAVCNSDGSCQCADGMEACNEVCTPSCPSGQYFDANCECSVITSCGTGETLCNGQCSSTSCPSYQKFDPSVCGCVDICESGKGFCGGNCIDIVNDRINCGSCGNTCLPNVPCIAGTCECPFGQSYVNGMCK